MRYDFEKIKKIEIIVKQIIKNVKKLQEFLDFVNIYLNVKKLRYNNNDEAIFTQIDFF